MLAQLDTKTVYTFMDSMVTIENYVGKVKELGYHALGIMDKNSLYAAYSFMESCNKMGLQPIIGCELDWKLQEGDQDVTTQLIALTTRGYRNLLKISTAKMTGQDDFETIRQYLVDIAVVIPYFSGIEHL
ncbi:PHP domain-containing protein, partial [Streptococcus suis]